MDIDPSPGQLVFVLVIAFIFSAFFSIIKIVFSACTTSSQHPGREALRVYAPVLEAIARRRLLHSTVVSLGRSCSTVAFAYSVFLLCRHLMPFSRDWAFYTAAFASSSLALTLCAWSIPRAFARQFAPALLPFVYWLYQICSWLLLPAASVVSFLHRVVLRTLGYDERFAFLSAEEKSRMSEHPDTEESLDEEGKEMIRSIFELGDTSVEEIMLPRIDIHAIEIGTNLETVLNLVREKGHSRLPVYKDTIDSIVGMLYVKDVLGWLSRHQPDEWNLVTIMKTPHFVPSNKKIDDLMREFKARRIHMAVVVDEYGGTAGIVTMEDILEEIVGEIQDEYDNEETPITSVGEGVFEVDPQVDLYELSEELDIPLDSDDADFNTLGGLIYHQHGDIPQPGTSVEFRGLRITVLEMDNQRIQRVEVRVPGNSTTGNNPA